MRNAIAVFLACLSVALVRAQTLTVANAAGQTVVEVITVNPQGLPTTQILQTIGGVAGGAAGTTTTTPRLGAGPLTTTTTQGLQQGPVAQPAPTAAAGQTTFYYTTTDALGATTVVLGTFSPTFNTAVVTPSQALTGSILGYSQYLSIVGTNTVAANQVSGSTRSLRLSSSMLAASSAFFSGLLGGVVFVLTS